jgi:putative membrane protein
MLRRRTVLLLSFREVMIPLGVFFSESVLAVCLARSTDVLKHLVVPDLTLSLAGTAISVLLAFRINAAYARWWEARALWGAISNTSRSLLRQAIALPATVKNGGDREFAQTVGLYLIEYAQSLNQQVTMPGVQPSAYERSRGTRAVATITNPSGTILISLARVMATAVHENRITDLALHRLDTTLSELVNAQGGIERIRNTPMPRAFDIFPLLFVYVYALLLPLALADELGLFVPFVTTAIVFAFLVLTRIGTNLESPFARTPYAVATDQVVDGIRTFVTMELAAF